MIQLPLNSTLNSNSFPPLKPNVRYRTAMERAGFDVVSPTSPSGSKAPSIRTGSRVGSRVVSRVVSHGSYASGAGKKVVNKGPMGNGPAKGPFHPYASSQQVHSKSADSVYRKGVTPPGTTPGPGKSVPGVVPAHHYRQMSPGSLSVDQAFHRLNGEGQGQGQNQNQNQEQEQAFDKISFDFERRADSENSISSEKQQPVFPPVPMLMSSPNLNSNSSSTYNTPQLGAGPAGAGSFPAIDPVEQSFQQLTNEKRGKPEERQEEEEEEDDDDDDDYVPDLAPKTDLQSLQSGAVPTPVPASNQNDSISFKPSDSISFEPNEALNKVLESAPQSVPGIFVTQEHEEPEQEEPDTFSDSELPLEPEPALQLGLKGEPEEEEEEPEVASVNGHVTDQTLVESQSPAQAQPRAASPLPHATITHVPHLPEHEGKLTAMEKLIAELDTVTLAREEEQLDIPTTSFMPQTVNKKSSAYMSRYEPQRIIIPDSPPAVGNSHMSIQSNSTPTFYKFRKDLGPLAPEMEEEQHHQQQQEQQQQQQQQQEHSSVPPPAKLKFPPGQGPCRHCNKEVLHKGIYSKHENELSGQWHRGCFKCIVCEKPFSKKVPCYILDDQPYCQLHFHESNNSICKVCDGFIEGECLENDKNERYHPSCLKCYICDHPITTDYYVYNHKHTICHNHDLAELHRSPNLRDLGRSNTLSKRRTRLINFA